MMRAVLVGLGLLVICGAANAEGANALDSLAGSTDRDLFFANLAGGLGGVLDSLADKAADGSENAFDLY